jgi:uncharacterized damage-inducible protein DinB
LLAQKCITCRYRIYILFMLIDTLKTLYSRDLNMLKLEISQYRNEEKIWYIEQSIANSAGNLCLHLVGNLNAFIGAELGKTGYIRNRPDEFSLKNIPRFELIRKVEETIYMIENTLDQLSEDDLAREYPLIVFDKKMSTEYFLVHLATHLAYHLGQINYHRRLLDN